MDNDYFETIDRYTFDVLKYFEELATTGNPQELSDVAAALTMSIAATMARLEADGCTDTTPAWQRLCETTGISEEAMAASALYHNVENTLEANREGIIKLPDLRYAYIDRSPLGTPLHVQSISQILTVTERLHTNDYKQNKIDANDIDRIAARYINSQISNYGYYLGTSDPQKSWNSSERKDEAQKLIAEAVFAYSRGAVDPTACEIWKQAVEYDAVWTYEAFNGTIDLDKLQGILSDYARCFWSESSKYDNMSYPERLETMQNMIASDIVPIIAQFELTPEEMSGIGDYCLCEDEKIGYYDALKAMGIDIEALPDSRASIDYPDCCLHTIEYSLDKTFINLEFRNAPLAINAINTITECVHDIERETLDIARNGIEALREQEQSVTIER